MWTSQMQHPSSHTHCSASSQISDGVVVKDSKCGHLRCSTLLLTTLFSCISNIRWCRGGQQSHPAVSASHAETSQQFTQEMTVPKNMYMRPMQESTEKIIEFLLTTVNSSSTTECNNHLRGMTIPSCRLCIAC